VETFNRWIRRPALMDLLRIGLSGEMPNPAYDLQNVNLEKLLRVAPQVEYFDTFDPIGRRADPGVELGVPDSITIVPIVEDDAIPLVEDGESPLSLALSPSYAVPNQTIVVTGRGFTNGGSAGINDTNDASSVVIDDDPTGLKAANVVSATSKINEGRKITIDGGGSWSSTIVLPINHTTISPGTHDLKITDNSGREGVGRLIIAPLTLSLDTSEDRVGGLVEVTGRGFPADNSDNGAESAPAIAINYIASGTKILVATLMPDSTDFIHGYIRVPFDAEIPSTNSVTAEFEYTPTGGSRATCSSPGITHNVRPAGFTIGPNSGPSGIQSR
jgi:hypothetical protein